MKIILLLTQSKVLIMSTSACLLALTGAFIVKCAIRDQVTFLIFTQPIDSFYYDSSATPACA